MKKIEMRDTIDGITLDEGFDIFVRSCEVRNLRPATIRHYENTMRSVYKFIEPKTLIKDITKDVVDDFVLHCRKDLDIKDITINTYLRGLKTILYYFMKMEYMNNFHIALIKYDKEIIETYSEAELKILLKKPNTRKCHFADFRNWTIINFLLGVGCRCSSLVNIRIADVDFASEIVYLKTTKNRKPLVIPLSKTLINVLREYMKIRKGGETDYLFCTVFGEKLNATTLNANVRNYNRKRGVLTTGVHRFRHTFAKNWILNKGDLFKLQKILGHSDLEMVRNYVNMFTTDIQKDFNNYNPLEVITRKDQ